MISFQHILLAVVIGFVTAFSPSSLQHATVIRSLTSTCGTTTTSLQMGKKIRNKQAELAQKMKLAKKQAAEKQGLDINDDDDESNANKGKLSDEEMKEMNDRRRFDDLLKQQAVTMNDISSDGYLSKQQEEAEMDAVRKFFFLKKVFFFRLDAETV